MTQRADSIEIWYGWVVVAASLMIGTIAMAAPNILFVSLKPIAADFGWPRAGPSMAFSLLMIGSGVGGIAMGWWMDKRGVMQPVLFGSVMVGLGALLARQSTGRWDFYTANGLLMGAFGEAAMIAPLIANGTRWFDRHRGLATPLGCRPASRLKGNTGKATSTPWQRCVSRLTLRNPWDSFPKRVIPEVEEVETCA